MRLTTGKGEMKKGRKHSRRITPKHSLSFREHSFWFSVASLHSFIRYKLRWVYSLRIFMCHLCILFTYDAPIEIIYTTRSRECRHFSRWITCYRFPEGSYIAIPFLAWCSGDICFKCFKGILTGLQIKETDDCIAQRISFVPELGK